MAVRWPGGVLRLPLTLSLVVSPLIAQQAAPPATLANTGRPIPVPFECTEDDVDWAGLSCTPSSPCAAYLEIASVGAVGEAVVAAGNIHTESQTLYSILLVSHDAGASWREGFQRLRGVTLDRVYAIGDTAWVSGQTVFPVTQAPFFLLTTDGGKTWRRQPVFPEPKGGRVLGFAFDDSKSGRLFFDAGPGGEGDRYEIYRTTDAGVSWAIQETLAKRPEVPPLAGSDWRVTVNAPKKAYELERRAGPRWSAVAAFAVGLNGCKPVAH